MLAVQVELLTGRYVASAYNDRSQVEWPPHPARFYSALVATWAETGAPEAEGAALDALADLPAPRMHVPEIQRPRDASTYYVPVNDASGIRTYASNWGRMQEAWSKRDTLEVERKQTEDPKAQRKLDKQIARLTKKIEKEREKVASFKPGKGKGALGLFPEERTKQPRQFPSVAPDTPGFSLIWAEATGVEHHLQALDNLLARVHRLGHSSSLVLLRRVAEAPEPNWSPHEDGDTAIRWVASGQRQALAEYHGLHQGVEPRVMPAVTVAYGRAEALGEAEATSSNLAGDLIVYERSGGPPVPITQSVPLAETIHRALVKMAEPLAGGGVHSAVSGRDANGKATRNPHVLILPLPYVASRYADGGVMGVAFAIPQNVTEEGRLQILRALGRWEKAGNPEDRMIKVHRPQSDPLELRRILGKSDRYNLQPSTWCRGSRTWVTVTPIALDRNPKTLWASSAEAARKGEQRAVETICKGCERIGLPRPERVDFERSPPLLGTEPVASHPPFPNRGRGPRRVQVHARLRFPTRVRGPVALGAGRFRGTGLLRPIRGSLVELQNRNSEEMS
jgi:CRISPR-associated protein Csb2